VAGRPARRNESAAERGERIWMKEMEGEAATKDHSLQVLQETIRRKDQTIRCNDCMELI